VRCLPAAWTGASTAGPAAVEAAVFVHRHHQRIAARTEPRFAMLKYLPGAATASRLVLEQPGAQLVPVDARHRIIDSPSPDACVLHLADGIGDAGFTAP